MQGFPKNIFDLLYISSSTKVSSFSSKFALLIGSFMVIDATDRYQKHRLVLTRAGVYCICDGLASQWNS